MSRSGPPHVVVVGSINLDLVARVARLPRPGETVRGDQLVESPGGKGANQAVAVARLGGRCTMIGRVGDDGFGPRLLDGLAGYGVNVDHVCVTHACSSGVALIGVDAEGQNAITIVAGANARLTPEDVESRADLIASADALLVQWEVPLPTVRAALGIARRAGILTVLDPAPIPDAHPPADALDVDVISPNQSESEGLTGLAVRDEAGAVGASERLRVLGARRVALKMGEKGAFWYDEHGRGRHVPAAPVEVLDTTAAGDAFTAALTLGLAEGRDPIDAVRLGCAAGSLATTRPGAQSAMPDRAEVLRFLESLP